MDFFLNQTTHLSPSHQQAILRLTALCQQHDSIPLSYPVWPEDGASAHYLLMDPQLQLLSALTLIPLDEDTCECVAFTHPEYRQKGCFSRLLEQALEDCGECDLLFSVSENCADTLAVLETLGAEFSHRELRMERDLSSPLFSAPSSLCAVDLIAPDDIFSENAVWKLVRHSFPSDVLGSCLTSPVSPGVLCLHQVEIASRLRTQGFGTELLVRLLTRLRQENSLRRILLHVSDDNLPAVALYKKTGFRITETLSCYWY